MLQTISIIVNGKVQGVFFRQGTREKACELGVTGFVQNQPDGTVYILATGTIKQLDAFTNWCQQGPPRAAVTGIRTTNEVLQLFDSFTIRLS